jgi:dynactin-4
MMTVDENKDIEPIPFVDYYCACSAAKKEKDTSSTTNNNSLSTSTTTSTLAENNNTIPSLTAESAASVTGRHLLSNQASNYLYPLSRLYFCEDCHQIRCPSCVQDEIVSYYCPNCLFEVYKNNVCF